MNATEIRNMNARNEQRGWLDVPDTCPPIFAAKIAELRAANLTRRKDAEVWTFDTAIPGAPHGVEIRSAVTPAPRSQRASNYLDSPEWRATVAAAKRTQAEIAAKQEERNAEAAKNAAIVRNELFPWEN